MSVRFKPPSRHAHNMNSTPTLRPKIGVANTHTFHLPGYMELLFEKSIYFGLIREQYLFLVLRSVGFIAFPEFGRFVFV